MTAIFAADVYYALQSNACAEARSEKGGPGQA